MKIFAGLFLSLFVAAGASAQSKWCDNLIQNGDTTVCQDFTRKGKLFREHFYVGGKRAFTRWWNYRKNGEYQVTQHKGKGGFAKKHGPAIRFYPDGTVKLYMFFQNGIRTGRCFHYYPSGKMKSACNTNAKGKPDGMLTEFYENGQVATQSRWKDGRLMEIITNKDEEGKDKPFGTLKNGTGTWIYQEPGSAKTWIHQYKDGKFIKVTKAQKS